MTQFLQVEPLKIFQIKGENCPIISVAMAPTVGNNNSIVAAVSGYAYRIMGWILQSDSAVDYGSIQFKSNSGGTMITGKLFVPIRATGLTHDLPIVQSGYCSTSTGHGIFADVTTANIIGTLFYITYVP